MEMKFGGRVPRNTQLNAIEFDWEMYKLLSGWMMKTVEYFGPACLNVVKAEIELLVRILIFRHSVWKNNASFGQELLNLEYNPVLERKKRILFFTAECILPYIKDKCQSKNSGFFLWLKRALEGGEACYKLFKFLNFIMFIKEGEYPSLINRLLGLNFTPKTKLNRNVGYGNMTRELIWTELMELFLWALPMLNNMDIKGKTANTFQFLLPKPEIKQVCEFRNKCLICKQSPVYPHRLSAYCKHVACDYCIKKALSKNGYYICTSCGAKVTDKSTTGLYFQ